MCNPHSLDNHNHTTPIHRMLGTGQISRPFSVFFLTTLGPMRQELSIPILQRSKSEAVGHNWPKVLWQLSHKGQTQTQMCSTSFPTTGPQPPAGEGTREPQKVLNRKQKSWGPFWDSFLVASQEA